MAERSPTVEIEVESPEEQEKLIEIMKKEVPKFKEVEEEAEKEERKIIRDLAKVDLWNFFKGGQVWITVIPKKPERKE